MVSESGQVFTWGCNKEEQLDYGTSNSLFVECLVEPRSALQLLEIADSLDADDLGKHCEVFFP